MNLKHRKNAFVQLGQTMGTIAKNTEWPGFSCGLTQEEYEAIQQKINVHIHTNGWFTPENIKKALHAWSIALTAENLDQWLLPYFPAGDEQPDAAPKNIGIICAGNIPLVGFHDVLCVLLCGHKALIKLSSADNVLLPEMLKILVKLAPEMEQQFEIMTDRLTGYDAVIATGSNNTSRYFQFYFKDVPHIIRKSRTSVAVLTGNETPEELTALGHDIFDYFGLGCRNISRIFLPEGYNLDKLFNGIFSFGHVVNHNKYANNYDYNKAVWLLNMEDLLDNGFILLKKDERIASPTASLFYTYYTHIQQAYDTIAEHEAEIQCVVSSTHIPFGQAQTPQLWDYADGVDTLKFITSLA
jgi:Acyl-CoA reductase (LuxC)